MVSSNTEENTYGSPYRQPGPDSRDTDAAAEDVSPPRRPPGGRRYRCSRGPAGRRRRLHPAAIGCGVDDLWKRREHDVLSVEHLLRKQRRRRVPVLCAGPVFLHQRQMRGLQWREMRRRLFFVQPVVVFPLSDTL